MLAFMAPIPPGKPRDGYCRNRRAISFGGLVAMQAVYIVQMEPFLVPGAGDYQIGAWLGMLAAKPEERNVSAY
jgi:hypothetical protein